MGYNVLPEPSMAPHDSPGVIAIEDFENYTNGMNIGIYPSWTTQYVDTGYEPASGTLLHAVIFDNPSGGKTLNFLDDTVGSFVQSDYDCPDTPYIPGNGETYLFDINWIGGAFSVSMQQDANTSTISLKIRPDQHVLSQDHSGYVDTGVIVPHMEWCTIKVKMISDSEHVIYLGIQQSGVLQNLNPWTDALASLRFTSIAASGGQEDECWVDLDNISIDNTQSPYIPPSVSIITPIAIAGGAIAAILCIARITRKRRRASTADTQIQVDDEEATPEDAKPAHYARPPVPEKIIIKEIVKVRCKYCGHLVENTESICPNCHASM